MCEYRKLEEVCCITEWGSRVCVCVCAEEQEQEDGSPVASVTSCGGHGRRVDPWEMAIIMAISMIKPL